jgi:hypothetical protein
VLACSASFGGRGPFLCLVRLSRIVFYNFGGSRRLLHVHNACHRLLSLIQSVTINSTRHHPDSSWRSNSPRTPWQPRFLVHLRSISISHQRTLIVSLLYALSSTLRAATLRWCFKAQDLSLLHPRQLFDSSTFLRNFVSCNHQSLLHRASSGALAMSLMLVQIQKMDF